MDMLPTTIEPITTNIITNITNKTQIKQTCKTYYDNIKSYIIIFYNYIKQLLIIDKYVKKQLLCCFC